MDLDFNPNEIEDDAAYNSTDDDYSDLDNLDDFEDLYEDESLFVNNEIEKKNEKKTDPVLEDVTEVELDEVELDEVELEEEEDQSEDEEILSNLDIKEQEDDTTQSKTLIQTYKKENVENFSNLGIISLLTNLVHYIKTGGSMLDGRETFYYPEETEESYAIESIILQTHPFVYVINNKMINLNHESTLICLKRVLRPVSFDKTIFFTPFFVESFPVFTKNLFNDYISKEEWEEIENIKKTRNIVI